MLKLTDELRKILSEPQGELYEGEGSEPLIRALSGRSYSFLACVGDVVSYYALRLNFCPDIIVIDGKSVRRSVEGLRREIIAMSEGYVEITARNPPGYITEDLVEKVHMAVKSARVGKKVRVFVDGEEDLAVMPLTVMLPKSSLIVYGQPGRGVVALDVDSKRGEVLRYIESMEVIRVETLEKLRRWFDGDSR